MASISVRKLGDDTLARLRVRAAKHGISMEEEARRIIRRAVTAPEAFGGLAVRLFAPSYGEGDFELPEREHTDIVRFE